MYSIGERVHFPIWWFDRFRFPFPPKNWNSFDSLRCFHNDTNLLLVPNRFRSILPLPALCRMRSSRRRRQKKGMRSPRERREKKELRRRRRLLYVSVRKTFCQSAQVLKDTNVRILRKLFLITFEDHLITLKYHLNHFPNFDTVLIRDVTTNEEIYRRILSPGNNINLLCVTLNQYILS